jgi:hypothetical protein
MILHRLARWLGGSHDFLRWGAAGLLLGWATFAAAVGAVVSSTTAGTGNALLILTVGLGVALLILSGEWLWRREERTLRKGPERERRIAAKERALGIGAPVPPSAPMPWTARPQRVARPAGTSRLVGRATVYASRRRVRAAAAATPRPDRGDPEEVGAGAGATATRSAAPRVL